MAIEVSFYYMLHHKHNQQWSCQFSVVSLKSILPFWITGRFSLLSAFMLTLPKIHPNWPAQKGGVQMGHLQAAQAVAATTYLLTLPPTLSRPKRPLWRLISTHISHARWHLRKYSSATVMFLHIPPSANISNKTGNRAPSRTGRILTIPSLSMLP